VTDPFNEIMVAEANGRIKIYFSPTLVAMVTNFGTKIAITGNM